MKGVMLKIEDLKCNPAIEMPDVPTMYDMTESEYRDYVEGDNLLFLDEHGILRDALTSRPVATTLEQLDLLLDQLEKYQVQMRSNGDEE